MPSAMAWRARSALVQWVMCSPSAIGSRQASSMIRARWRGGNLLRPPDARFVQQEWFQPALLVAAADAPDHGPVTLQPRGDGLNRLFRGDGQHDPGMLHLEPGQAATAGHGLEDGSIRSSNGQGARLASTHGTTSEARAEGYLQHTPWPEFVARLMARAN
jgi:hypothetical protein